MIQFNPLQSYIDGGARAAITTPPSASLVFDLPGKAIWAKGVKLKGTDHTYTFSHDNYITLTNTPDQNNPESEDIQIGVDILALKNVIDTTYNVVSQTWDGLAPAFNVGNIASATASAYYLGWSGTTLKWYQRSWRNVRINNENADTLAMDDNDPLVISSGTGIQVAWDSTNKQIVITNTAPDQNHNTDYRVTQAEVTNNTDYRVLFKRTADDTAETNFVNFSGNLTFNPTTNVLKINSARVITIADIMTGATATTDGTVGLVPAPTINDRFKFLRGDGTWVPSDDTWREIYLNDTSIIGSQVDTGAINLKGIGIQIIHQAPGTGTGQSGSTDYSNLIFQLGGAGKLQFKTNNINLTTFEIGQATDTVIDITTGSARGAIAVNNIDVEVFGPIAFLGDADEDSLTIPQFDAAVHCVHVIPQLLSNEQKQTARNNIGAISMADLPNTVQQALAQNDMDRPILLKNGGGTATIVSTTLFSGVTVNASTNLLKAASIETSGRITAGGSLAISSSSYSAIFTHSGSAFTLALDDTPDPKDILTIAVPNGNITIYYEAAFNGQIVSNVDNAAPFVITSTTLNSNLNADLLDGKHLNEIFTVFEDAGNQVTRLVIGGVPLTLNIDADTVDGLHVHSGINSEADKIVRTNATGVIVAGLINTTTDNLGNTATGKVYVAASGSNDIKYKPFTDFLNEIRGAETVEITKNLAPTTSWAATGIATTDLDTGTYVVQLSTGTHYLSGVMSWYANTGGMAEEIALHYAGSGSPVRVYLRTYNGTLEIAADSAWSATDFTFKFKKEIL